MYHVIAATILLAASLLTPTDAFPAPNRPDYSTIANVDAMLRNVFSYLLNEDRQFVYSFFDQLSGSDPRVRIVVDRILDANNPDAQVDAMATLAMRLVTERRSAKKIASVEEDGNGKSGFMKGLALAKKAHPDFNPSGW